jgi:hypothetical protein
MIFASTGPLGAGREPDQTSAPIKVVYPAGVAAIALPRQDLAEDLEFDCLHGGYVQYALDHRHLDKLSAAGGFGKFQRRKWSI